MYLNRVTLIGFLGHDARTAATQAGREVTRLSVATTRRYQQESEWKEKTQWHDCVVYGREYSRTMETEAGPIQVAWPVTEVIVESISRLDRTRKEDHNEPEGGRLRAALPKRS